MCCGETMRYGTEQMGAHLDGLSLSKENMVIESQTYINWYTRAKQADLERDK